MTALTITQEDFGFDIIFTLKDSDGNVVDLSSVTEARFSLVQVDDFRKVLDRLATVQSPPEDGVVKYTSENGDFKRAGNFNGALVLKFGTSKIVTTRRFFVSVEPKLR